MTEQEWEEFSKAAGTIRALLLGPNGQTEPSWAAEYIARLDCDRAMQVQNTEAILNALQRIHDAILSPPDRGRTVTQQDADAIGKAVAKAMHVPRNNRP